MSDAGLHAPLDESAIDLLIKQVTEGLSPEELRTLQSLDEAAVERQLHGFEESVAAVTLANLVLRPPEPPPLQLLARIEADGIDYFRGNGPRVAEGTTKFAARSNPAGWWAAAACLLLALFGWRHPSRTPDSPPIARAPAVQLRAPPAPAAEPMPTLSEQRRLLVAKLESVRVNLQATKDPAAAGVSADVVWDPSTQKGFLRLVGLRANDPRMQQYQTWIFDGARDKRYPVDAGVFDVAADTGEVIVPIRSTLPIRLAKAFAVTVEKPGGVVVSALHHVIALGAPG